MDIYKKCSNYKGYGNSSCISTKAPRTESFALDDNRLYVTGKNESCRKKIAVADTDGYRAKPRHPNGQRGIIIFAALFL